MFNQVSIVGYLATPPKSSIIGDGTPKTQFLLAYNSTFTDRNGIRRQKAEFFWVETFGRSALNVAQNLVLGQQVAVAGQLAGGNVRLADGSYKNCTVVVSHCIEYLTKPKRDAFGGSRRSDHRDPCQNVTDFESDVDDIEMFGDPTF